MHEHIATRCPACGNQTLFIGHGGLLVCSWLQCKSPGQINNVSAMATAIQEYTHAKLDFDTRRLDDGDQYGWTLRHKRLVAAEERLRELSR